MASKAYWTPEALKAKLRAILDKHGPELTCKAYDSIDEPDRPGRETLKRQSGISSWDEIKQWAYTEDVPQDKPHEAIYSAVIGQNKELHGKLSKAHDYAQIIIDCCMVEIAKLRIDPVPVPQRRSMTENLEFHLLRSDAQVGQFTDPKWTQGISCYSATIYRDRVLRLLDKVMLFKQQDERSLGLNKLILYYLGDQVEGEAIFKGQAFSLDMSGVEQLFFSVEVESSFIMSLAQHFNEIEVYCVPGNHGRPAGKGDNHPKTNFDYVFYRILQMTLASQPNVKVFVSESPSMLIQNGDFNFLLNHGDAAKSWGGIPFYGLDRMAKRVNDLYNMIIHFNLVGHHHQPCNLADKVIMNGCIPGGSDLSVNRLMMASAPSQKCFYFHPRFGINRESNLYLAEPVRLTADHNGIFTAYS